MRDQLKLHVGENEHVVSELLAALHTQDTREYGKEFQEHLFILYEPQFELGTHEMPDIDAISEKVCLLCILLSQSNAGCRLSPEPQCTRRRSTAKTSKTTCSKFVIGTVKKTADCN